jgi:hypothetical protein
MLLLCRNSTVSWEYSSDARLRIVCSRRRLMKGKLTSTGKPERYNPLPIKEKFMGGTRTVRGRGVGGADICAVDAGTSSTGRRYRERFKRR